MKSKKRLRNTLFVLPAFILHFAVITLPALTMIYLSMTDWNGLDTPRFVGLKNFVRMLSDYDFKVALKNNILWMSLFLFIPLILGLGLALVCQRIGSVQMLYRTLLFMPYVVGPVLAGKIFAAFYSPLSGIFPLLAKHGFKGLQGFAPLGDRSIALFAVAFVDNWHWWGFVLVLMMSALHQVDPDLNEAAKIEGANPVQIFFHVTLPQIMPTITSYLTLVIVGSFKAFDYVWVMTGGGPAGATELCATWIYKKTFVSFDAGYGSALSLTICLGVLAFYILQSQFKKLFKRAED